MDLSKEKRIILTLDAGGTNFRFNAMQGGAELFGWEVYPSYGNDLELCLDTIIEGFQKIKNKLDDEPVAISFGFPGPADFPGGIIGDLANLTAFRGGVALGPMLEDIFGIPVFINNDGDLFAYGEAIAGFLPYINNILESRGSSRRYRNLFGVTLGTGFGGGIVYNNELYTGDNAASAEIWCMRNKLFNYSYAEESVSIRGIKRAYFEFAGLDSVTELSPKDIYDIAIGNRDGNTEAAKAAFAGFGEVIGDALINTATLLDCLVVIGGGIAGAYKFFLPEIIREMNRQYRSLSGEPMMRSELKAFNLEDEHETESFVRGEVREINVPKSAKKVLYDPMKRIGVGLSRLGTTRAISIGAYTFALKKLDSGK